MELTLEESKEKEFKSFGLSFTVDNQSEPYSKVGSELVLSTGAEVSINVAQESFIPTCLARSQLESVQGGMVEMREKYLKLLKSVQEQYQSVEDEVQNHFLQFIVLLKRKANEKINEEKKTRKRIARKAEVG